MALTNPIESLNIWQTFKDANKAYEIYTAQQSANFWSDNNFPTNDPIWSEGDYWGPNVIELPDESHIFMTLGQYRLGYLGGVDAWEYQSGSGNTYVETINTYFVKHYGRNASYDEMEYWYDTWLQAAAKDDFFLKNGWFSNQVTPLDEAAFANSKLTDVNGTYKRGSITYPNGSVIGPGWYLESGSATGEFAIIANWYESYLGRPADKDGIEWWYSQIPGTYANATAMQADWETAADAEIASSGGTGTFQSYGTTVDTSATWTYKDNAEGNPIIFDDPISAKILWRMIMTDIQRYTRIRLAHITIEVTGEGGSSGTLYGAAYTKQGICFDQTGAALLNWDYLLPFPNTYPVSTGWPRYLTPNNGGIMKIQRGYKVMAGVLENWYAEIVKTWNKLQSDNTIEVELSGCHSSCHSSCHGSRGRR